MAKKKLEKPVRLWRWNDGCTVPIEQVSQIYLNRGDQYGKVTYDPIKVRCPDGKLRTCKIKDNIYGQETYLGDIYHTITIPLADDKVKKKRVRIPGYVQPNGHEYFFTPNADAMYAYVLYPAKERLV